jgi:hypothetical protein
MTEQGFVGTKRVDLSELKKLLSNLSKDKTYYFLKWIDKVKGFHPFNDSIFSDLSPEGQIFNSQWELRWRKQGKSFDLLLLSIEENIADFQPLKQDWIWQYQDRDVIVHPKKETRFLQSESLSQNAITNEIKQRYFIHQQTSTIHFIALTI